MGASEVSLSEQDLSDQEPDPTQPSGDEPGPAPLGDLLQALFSSTELRVLVSRLPQGAAILGEVAGAEAAPSRVAHDCSDQLWRRGLVDQALFERLAGLRPARRSAIAACAATYGISLAAGRVGVAALRRRGSMVALGVVVAALTLLVIQSSDRRPDPGVQLVAAEQGELRPTPAGLQCGRLLGEAGPVPLRGRCLSDRSYTHELELAGLPARLQQSCDQITVQLDWTIDRAEDRVALGSMRTAILAAGTALDDPALTEGALATLIDELSLPLAWTCP